MKGDLSPFKRAIARDKSEFKLPTLKMRENAVQYREVREIIVRQGLKEHENAQGDAT